MTAKDILLAVIIPLALAEVGPWCGWLAARLLPLAAKLRYGDTERAAVRLQEWSCDLNDIPGQLTKLVYAAGQLAAGSAVSAGRKTRSAQLRIYMKVRYRKAPPLLHSARVNADRPYAEKMWRRLEDLAVCGVIDSDGSQLFPDRPDDARLWNDPRLEPMTLPDRVWLIADLQRRAAEQGVAPG